MRAGQAGRDNAAREPGNVMPGHSPGLLTVITESSVRLRTLVDYVYSGYARQGVKGVRAGVGALVLPPSTGEVLTCVRHLAAELDDFAGLYVRHRDEIEGGLGDRGLCALHSLVGGQATAAGLVRDIRAALGSAAGLTLGELGSRVSPDQLEHILLYALLVTEFQGRLTGGSTGEGGFTRQEWISILDVPKPRSVGQSLALMREQERDFPGLDMGRHLRACSIMSERWDGMQKLREMLDGCLVEFEKYPDFHTPRLTWASYMLKYLVMDLADFARHCGTLGLGRHGGFARHLEEYEAIHGKYFAGKEGSEGAGAARLVREERGLLTMVLDDTEEAKFFINLIRPELFKAYQMPKSPRYSPDLAGISQKFERMRAAANAGGTELDTGAAADGIAGVFGSRQDRRPGL